MKPPIIMVWNPPKKVSLNLTIQCFLLGGVIMFGPNSFLLLAASAPVNPEGRDYRSVNISVFVIMCPGFSSYLKFAKG